MALCACLRDFDTGSYDETCLARARARAGTAKYVFCAVERELIRARVQ